MNTDRELLEMAAKAAGYLNWTTTQSCLFIETGHSMGNTGFHWNPLTDNGAALALALKTGLSITQWENNVSAVHGSTGREWAEPYGSDIFAAARRAIVRAAAEIGKDMK